MPKLEIPIKQHMQTAKTPFIFLPNTVYPFQLINSALFSMKPFTVYVVYYNYSIWNKSVVWKSLYSSKTHQIYCITYDVQVWIWYFSRGTISENVILAFHK